MTIKRKLLTLAIPAAFTLATAQIALAGPTELLTNGDFELGTFAGWTVTDLAGGSGSFFIDTPGNAAPISGLSTSALGGGPHGSFYAVSDQTGPGTHALTQSFAVAPGASSVTLSFDMFVNNYDGGPFCAPGLDHTGAAVECGRVDILTGVATPFDTGAGVLGNFFLGADLPLGANPHDFTHYSFDVSSSGRGRHVPGPLRRIRQPELLRSGRRQRKRCGGPRTRHARAARPRPRRTRLLAPQAVTDSAPTQAPLRRGLLFVESISTNASNSRRRASHRVRTSSRDSRTYSSPARRSAPLAR